MLGALPTALPCCLEGWVQAHQLSCSALAIHQLEPQKMQGRDVWFRTAPIRKQQLPFTPFKSAFAPTVPRQPFFRLLGDPKTEPWWSSRWTESPSHAPTQSSHWATSPTTWYMPHEMPGVFHMLLRHGPGFGLSDPEETAKVVGHRPLGSSWFRPEKVQATSSFAC